MLDPADLYRLDGDPEDGRAPVLLLRLQGFVDAGHAARLAVETLAIDQDPRLVAEFDVDQLVDYRARRPAMRFDRDRWASYDTPELTLSLLADAKGAPFLLLSGPEPDFQWERFTAAVGELIELLGVELTIGLNGIPLAVPHTRPMAVTTHGTRPELVEGHPRWFGTVDVPGSAAALVQLRLGETGHDAMGLAVHVPHYLARSEYPLAAQTLLEHVEKVTGLSLPSDSLSEAAERARTEVDEQVAGSEQVAQLVQALEAQYDTMSEERAASDSLDSGGELPSGDEIAAEFERFLAEQGGPGDGRD